MRGQSKHDWRGTTNIRNVYIALFIAFLVFFILIPINSKSYPAKPYGLNVCMNVYVTIQNAINMANEYPNIFRMPKDAE